jgi:hypothetical protein
MITAFRWSAESLENVPRNLCFDPYAPVRRQLYGIYRAVERLRRAAGFSRSAGISSGSSGES